MDSQPPNLPEIKAEVNKEEEKKGAGLFGGLFSGGGGASGAGGLGAGAGGAGLGAGAGGAGLAGGLLATKAGIIAVVLAGTTVAGGGLWLFGPGKADKSEARSLNLFAEKPKPAPGAEGEGAGDSSGAGKDGNSASLDYLVKGNAGSGEEEAKPEEAPAADNAGASAQAPVVVGDGQNNKGNVMGNKAASMLKDAKKFGELSKLGAGGGAGGGRSGASDSAGAGPGTLLASSKSGASSGFGGSKAGAAGGSLRGLAGGRRKAGAFRQLGSVRKDQVAGRSSQQTGVTYDGGKSAGSGIASDNAAADGGAGATSGDTKPRSGSGGGDGGSSDRFPSPPQAPPRNVTPWQGAINTATLLLAGAALLLMVAGKMATADKTDISGSTATIVRCLAALAILLSIAAIALGAMISGGKYGQQFQGTMFIMAGSFLSVAAIALIAGAPAEDTEMSGGYTAVLVLSGAAGLASLIGGYLTPPRKYPPSTFQDGKAPDLRFSSAWVVPKAPSEDLLSRYV